MKDKILIAVVPLIKTYGLHFKMIDLARELGMSKSTLYRKINTGGDDFTIGEVLSITKALHLSADEGQQIFFAQNVAYDATMKE